MGTGTIQVLIYGHMGTGTIWGSFRSVSVVCWLIGDLTIWFVGCDPHTVFLDICFISVNEQFFWIFVVTPTPFFCSVNEQFWTRTPFFCRCEVRNFKLRIRVIDLELLGDLTFWLVGGCDSHPVFLYPLKTSPSPPRHIPSCMADPLLSSLDMTRAPKNYFPEIKCVTIIMLIVCR